MTGPKGVSVSGLDPGIYVLPCVGTKDVDGRVKPGQGG
jgi:hypothetical protein